MNLNEALHNIPEDRTPRLVHWVDVIGAGISWFLDRFVWSILIVSAVVLWTCAALSAMKTNMERREAAGQEGARGAAREYWAQVEKEIVR